MVHPYWHVECQYCDERNRRADRTYVEKAGAPGFDSLKTFFQTVNDDEAGVVPNRSMSKSPLTSSGMGCAMLDDGTRVGVCAVEPMR